PDCGVTTKRRGDCGALPPPTTPHRRVCRRRRHIYNPLRPPPPAAAPACPRAGGPETDDGPRPGTSKALWTAPRGRGSRIEPIAHHPETSRALGIVDLLIDPTRLRLAPGAGLFGVGGREGPDEATDEALSPARAMIVERGPAKRVSDQLIQFIVGHD